MIICNLCRKEKKLIEAHIVPKWAYMNLYNNESDKDKRSLILVEKNKYDLKRPMGSYDPNILCANCDNFLGKYDEYGKKVFLDSPLEKRGKEAYVVKNVDFDRLRIFLISVVWRASISNLGEYKKFSIGPYSDRIREILFNIINGNSVINLINYSFIIGKFQAGSLPLNVVNKNIQTPHTQKIDGINTTIFYMPNGLKVFVKTDKRSFTGAMKELANYSSEGLIIAKLGDYADSEEFQFLIDIIKSRH